MFTNVTFCKRVGEEYSEPLILTGTVVFKPAAPRFEERTTGRRTMRLWRHGRQTVATMKYRFEVARHCQ